jgi:hypothetical protein
MLVILLPFASWALLKFKFEDRIEREIQPKIRPYSMMSYFGNYILDSGEKNNLHAFSDRLASLPQILLNKSPRIP